MSARVRKVNESDLTPEQRSRVDAARTKLRDPAKRAEEKSIRERFQAERPTLDVLVASGKYDGPFPHGDFLALMDAVVALKLRRERLGLSLAEVSKRTGIDTGMLSRLENGKITNPTITTLMRFADALGATVRLVIE
ncbi:MAG: helix-turn-helix transcriptional regulator [Planctomycetota bacterium]|nr:helix-turn-helix transcriptional regulator [Planctomycetota bacterium]